MIKSLLFKDGGNKDLHKLILFVLLSELGVKLIGGELGGFLWIAFHFCINPIYCIYFLVISLKNFRGVQNNTDKLIYFLSFLVPIFYLIVLWKFNIEWMEFFNINFK